MVKKQGVSIFSYFWKTFECEICKNPYPCNQKSLILDIFKTSGLKYQLIDIEKPEGKFIILESLNLEKNSSRSVHIITVGGAKDQFKMVSFFINFRGEATKLILE
jgi:hypothetical protein